MINRRLVARFLPRSGRLADVARELTDTRLQLAALQVRLDELTSDVPILLHASEDYTLSAASARAGALLAAAQIRAVAAMELTEERGRVHAEDASAAAQLVAVLAAREHAEAAVAASLSVAVQAAREHAEAASSAMGEVVLGAAQRHSALELQEVRLRLVQAADEIGVVKNVVHWPSDSHGRADASGAGRRALLSLGAGPHSDLLAITRGARERYCDAHGYDLLESTVAACGDRPPAWSKIPMLQQALETYETVVWLDADAVICDFTVDLLDALPEAAMVGLVHHRYAGQCFPNTGVMVLRHGEQTQDFLAEMWAQSEYIEHPWWDNAAALRVLGYSITEPVVKVRPSRHDRIVAELRQRWNMIPQVGGRSPAVLHLPGFPNDLRREVLADLVRDPSLADHVLSDPTRYRNLPSSAEGRIQ